MYVRSPLKTKNVQQTNKTAQKEQIKLEQSNRAPFKNIYKYLKTAI